MNGSNGNESNHEENKDWRILGASVKGASHEKTGKPNQDAIHTSSTGEAVILAIADGHGSDKYFRSETGSRYAVEIAVAEVENILRQIPFKEGDWKDEDFSRMKQQLGELPKSIVARWRKKVDEHLEETPFFTKDEWKHFSNGKALPNVTKNRIIPYGATLLVALVTRKFIFCLQLGDGDIVFVRENGQSVKPMEDDKRLLANETTSLCTDTAVEDFRQKFLRLVSTPPALIMLSTDGYANSFSTSQGFLQVGGDILKQLREEDGLEKVQSSMKEWLGKATNQGSGDDITVGIVCHLSALKPPFPVAEPPAVEAPQQPVAPDSPPPPAPYYPSQQGPRLSNLPQQVSPINLRGTNSPDDVDPYAKTTYAALPAGDQAIQVPRPEKDTREPSPQFRSPSDPAQQPERPQERKPEANAQQIVVSQRGGGNYKTITDALQYATPDSVIHVYPGIYQESLYIDKNVALMAQGKVTIESPVPCLTVVAQEAYVEGFIIEGQWQGEEGRGGIAAIEVEKGNVKLTRCDIMSKSKRGIRVSGVKSYLKLYSCHIHDTKGDGIVFDDVAGGLLEGGAVYNNTLMGIRIRGIANNISTNATKSTEAVGTSNVVSLRGCEIYNNGQIGIIVERQGVVQVSDCLVRENKSYGILIVENSQATIQETEVNNNIDVGIFVVGSTVTAIGSRAVENRRSGVILQGGTAQLSNCFVLANHGYGISVIEHSEATIQGTEVKNNADTGISVVGSVVTAIGSQIVDNGRNGMTIRGQGTGRQLKNCIIRENKGYGIFICENSWANVEGGSISAKKDQSAMVFVQQSTGDIRQCTIESRDDSVVAREYTQLVFYKCTIDSRSCFFRAEKQSTITATDCFTPQNQEISKRKCEYKASQINLNYSQQDYR